MIYRIRGPSVLHRTYQGSDGRAEGELFILSGKESCCLIPYNRPVVNSCSSVTLQIVHISQVLYSIIFADGRVGQAARMSLFQRCLPCIIIAGQLLILFQIERREVQGLMLAFLVFQMWKKFKTNRAAELSDS